jgi:hypothetical protein
MYHMKVSFRTFKISWNTYFLKYLCQTRSHGRHLVDSSIALVSKSLTLPDFHACILSKVLIVLVGFPTLRAAFYTETGHEFTSSQQYDLRHTWYVVPQFRLLDSRGFQCWLQLACHWVIRGSILSRCVSNGSGPSLQLRVRVGTEPYPDWRPGSSIHPKYRFWSNSIDISLPVRIGRVPSRLYSRSISKFI